MSRDIFDRCPDCARKSILRTKAVYKCPKCSSFYCDRCRGGNPLFGYKCPHCKFHTPVKTLTQMKMGYC